MESYINDRITQNAPLKLFIIVSNQEYLNEKPTII